MKENKKYLETQLITYIGNKRKLLGFIEQSVLEVKEALNKDKLTILDGFSGSGIVSRALKQHSSCIHSNDMEYYSYIINNCYLTDECNTPIKELEIHISNIHELLNDKSILGTQKIMQELYAPQDDRNIKENERCFFTSENARRIDVTIDYIHNSMPNNLKPFLLAPLLSEVSIHANTSGVFKGFYKNSETKLGQFGGNGKNALNRILGAIKIEMPIFSNFNCYFKSYNMDTNSLVKQLSNDNIELDLAYFDPPYNQHPYGSNYFMLNIVATNKRPKNTSKVSGIPDDWNKSNYNSQKTVRESIIDLISNTNAKYILVSYNNEGFVSMNEMKDILNAHGTTSIIEKDYNTFRGSRNLNNRNNKVKEILFLLKK